MVFLSMNESCASYYFFMIRLRVRRWKLSNRKNGMLRRFFIEKVFFGRGEMGGMRMRMVMGWEERLGRGRL